MPKESAASPSIRRERWARSLYVGAESGQVPLDWCRGPDLQRGSLAHLPGPARASNDQAGAGPGNDPASRGGGDHAKLRSSRARPQSPAATTPNRAASAPWPMGLP